MTSGRNHKRSKRVTCVITVVLCLWFIASLFIGANEPDNQILRRELTTTTTTTATATQRPSWWFSAKPTRLVHTKLVHPLPTHLSVCDTVSLLVSSLHVSDVLVKEDRSSRRYEPVCPEKKMKKTHRGLVALMIGERLWLSIPIDFILQW